jgi:hypothetical protein
VGIADTEQRETGGAENVLGFELGDLRRLQQREGLFHLLFVMQQQETGLGCGIVMLFYFRKSPDACRFGFLGHCVFLKRWQQVSKLNLSALWFGWL